MASCRCQLAQTPNCAAVAAAAAAAAAVSADFAFDVVADAAGSFQGTSLALQLLLHRTERGKGSHTGPWNLDKLIHVQDQSVQCPQQCPQAVQQCIAELEDARGLSCMLRGG
eukprot:1160545-Pelagomonas_calceolata.AAC.27